MSADGRYHQVFRTKQEQESKGPCYIRHPHLTHEGEWVCNQSSMPFPERFGMLQNTKNSTGSKADTVSYLCKSYPGPVPVDGVRSLEKAPPVLHVLPPDGSHCWRRRIWFPPLSLAINLFWKLWLQLAAVAAAISLVIFGEPRKNDSCFFNEFSYHQRSLGICSQLWTGRGCAQQLCHSQFSAPF